MADCVVDGGAEVVELLLSEDSAAAFVGGSKGRDDRLEGLLVGPDLPALTARGEAKGGRGGGGQSHSDEGMAAAL